MTSKDIRIKTVKAFKRLEIDKKIPLIDYTYADDLKDVGDIEGTRSLDENRTDNKQTSVFSPYYTYEGAE
jgi:predicted N-formylglutamate amidohydrolase